MATKASVQIEAEDKFSSTVRAAKAQFAGLQESIGRVTAVTGTLGGGFTSLAATFAAGGIIGGIKSMVSAFDDLDEAAQGAGVGAVALAEMRTAAQFAGVGAEKLDGALSKLNVKIADAAGGSKDAVAAFSAIGVSFKDVHGNVRSTEDVLRDVADKFSTYRDGAEKSALAVELFGKAGAKMVPLLNGGADGLRRFSGLTDETVQQAAKLQAEFDKLSANAEKVKNAFAGVVIPAINQTIDVMGRMDWKSFVGSFALGPAAIFRQGDLILQATKDLEAYNKVAEENRRLLGDPRLPANRSGKPAAPVIDKSGPPKAEQISDSTRALGAFVDQLNRQKEATEGLLEVEKALQLLKENPSIDTPQVREMLLNQAKLVDDLAAEKKMREDIAAINKKNLDEEIQAHKQLNDQIMELSGVTGENRKIALTEELDKIITKSKELEAQGLPPILNPEQIENAVKGIAGIKDELAKTSDTAQQFAMTFSSALEDVIVKGGNVSDMLQGLLQDILRIATRTLITTPLTNFLGGFFSGLGGLGGFGGGGGGAGASVPGLGSGDLLGGSLGLASNRRGGSGVTVVYNIAQVGSNVSRADMLSAMQQTRAATIGDLQDMSARGRLKLA